MEGQHGERHVVDHRLRDAGFHHPDERDVGRELRQVELVHAGADGEQDLEVRKIGQPLWRLPGREIATADGSPISGQSRNGRSGAERARQRCQGRPRAGLAL